ncbi:stressosome-associated protein Prli42 [Sporosarcina thermotolerans]|nr:stressosome-associated protein Prli42 [Sporosarcina thermotolerans]WHT47445.1 stressosome-associated protein Prli42 [Sporosarcina thermotolerans]
MSNKKVQKFVVYMMVLAMVALGILFGLSMFL